MRMRFVSGGYHAINTRKKVFKCKEHLYLRVVYLRRFKVMSHKASIKVVKNDVIPILSAKGLELYEERFRNRIIHFHISNAILKYVGETHI